jgi:hypothetical protein
MFRFMCAIGRKPRVSIVKAIITTRLSSLRLSSSINAPKIVLLYGWHDPVGTEWVRCHDGGHKVDTKVDTKIVPDNS